MGHQHFRIHLCADVAYTMDYFQMGSNNQEQEQLHSSQNLSAR